MRKSFAKVIVCVAFLYGSPVFGQSTNASLSGDVVDASGGALPFVMIKLEDIQTGIVFTGASNETGVYQFPSVQPGLYRLEAEFPGFQKIVYNLLTFEVGAQVRLNLTLKVAGATESLQVIALDSPLKMNTASVGSVVHAASVRDLPMAQRDVLWLTETQAGLVAANFSGARIGALNITRDGINVMDQRLNRPVVSSVIYTSTDLVSEFRVITSPVDAELGRGSGQVQIETRSGTNEFHGSVFETHNDTSLNANSWFNNQRGDPRDSLIWNQFGARLGGPIVKNKTFFHFLYDAQRRVQKTRVTSTTYTAPARQGVFRFFPGVLNANAVAAVPTVDLNGNPVRPPAATGDLQSIDVFGLDPIRPMDPTGTVTKLLSLMPQPNNFRVGDGLNTVGYSWNRRSHFNRDQYNLRLDHQFNERQRFNLSWTRERDSFVNTFIPPSFPQSPSDKTAWGSSFFSLNITSSLSPRLLNQFHAGAQRARFRLYAPWELDGNKLLPQANGIGYLVNLLGVSNPLDSSSGDQGPQGRISPLYVWGDKLAWLTGRHAFKVGGEARFGSSNGFNTFGGVTPLAFISPVDSIPFTSSPGLGLNERNAQSLLLNLSGSVGSVQQALNASPGANPVFLAGEGKQRTWRQREFSLFFKDDWSLRPNLVLNLGIRYEYYGVPWEANGKAAGLVGGSKGLFGLSGTSFGDLYQPGRLNGSLTKIELIGKNSANSMAQLYNDDWNNVAPAIGLNWSMPYFGKDKTVLRTGYSIGYEKNQLFLIDNFSGDEPGLRTVVRATQYRDLSRIQLPLTPAARPLDTVPLDDRFQNVYAFDSNLRTPYVQNWNFTVERELPGKMSLNVRYVGSKGTKLIRGTNINEANIFESGILDAFLVTQSGGNSPLLDRIFNGLSFGGLGPVNGTAVTGSQFARFHPTTRSYVASNGVGSFATYLSNTADFTNSPGGLLRRAGLPENLVVGNPQFANATLEANFANSTYHALEIDLNKRFSGGWNLQSNYTWSKTLGEEEGSSATLVDSYRNGRNRRLDKRRLFYDWEHVSRHSGTLELPFGPNKRFGSNSTGIVSRLIERWEFGAIVRLFSGVPLGFGSTVKSFNDEADNTPDLVGVLPKNTGRVTRVANGVTYFPTLHQAPDPAITATSQALNFPTTMKAIADAKNNIILVNPAAGKLGNMNQRYLEGPGGYFVDVDLIKRIRFGEGKEFEFRAVALGLLNSPRFLNPNTDINSPNFGMITTAVGNRIIELGARVSF